MRRTGQSVRKTRKQRGGANFRTPELGEHRESWTIKINELSPALKTKLLPLVDAGDTSDEARLEAYISAIEHQDELFDIATNLIREYVSETIRIELNSDADIINNAESINENKGILKSYIEDVEKMVSFVLTEAEKAKYSAVEAEGPGKSKLELIIDKQEPVSNLLIFPDRLKNIFIQSLANLFILLKNNQDNLSNIIKNNATINIAVDQYISNIYANAYLLTSHELRDGFYLNQGVNEFKSIIEGVDGENASFYSEFFNKIKSKHKLKLHRESSWDELAFAVFSWYLNTEFTEGEEYDRKSILKYVIDISSSEAVTEEEIFNGLLEAFPEKKYHNMNIDSNGTTLIKLLHIMEPVMLEFVLHLAYTLWKSHFEQQATPA